MENIKNIYTILCTVTTRKKSLLGFLRGYRL